jgi:hypothetical protein
MGGLTGLTFVLAHSGSLPAAPRRTTNKWRTRLLTLVLHYDGPARAARKDDVRSHCEPLLSPTYSPPHLGGTLSRTENSSTWMVAIWAKAGRKLGAAMDSKNCA